MPYAQKDGANKVVPDVSASSSPSTENYLAGNATDIRTFGKNIDEIKEAGIEDKFLGNTALNTLNQLNSADNRLRIRLSSFVQTIAAGGNVDNLTV